MKKAYWFLKMWRQKYQLERKWYTKFNHSVIEPMKKEIKDLQSKSVKDMNDEVKRLREEIATFSMKAIVNPSKDSNIIPKKRKRLAVLLTIITKKQQEEAVKKK